MLAWSILNGYVSGIKVNTIVRFKSILASAMDCPVTRSKSMPELGATC